MATGVPPLFCITGLAGAGKSTALHALEDLGWYGIDNLPLHLLPPLLAAPPVTEPGLAVVVDGRDPGFDGGALAAVLQRPNTRLLYLEAPDQVLCRRFQEGRRPHPRGASLPLAGAIAAERQQLAAVRDLAHHRIDTGPLTPAQLRAMVRSLAPPATGLLLRLLSFGFKHGLPPEADLVFDVRFLPNPHYVAELRSATGLEPAVADYVFADSRAADFLHRLLALLDLLLPAYRDTDRTSCTLALGCTGGRHRSVAVTERLAAALAQRPGLTGITVRTCHRELARP